MGCYSRSTSARTAANKLDCAHSWRIHIAMYSRRDIDRDMKKVVRFIERWGVRLELGRPSSMVGFYEGPIMGGIHWPTRTIWWPWDEPANELSACALLHELSHVVVDESPDEVSEIHSAMLAFEHAAMRSLRLPWSMWMDNFHLDVVDTIAENEPITKVKLITWNELPSKERHDLLAESRAKAIESGLMTPNGRLTFTLPSPTATIGACVCAQ